MLIDKSPFLTGKKTLFILFYKLYFIKPKIYMYFEQKATKSLEGIVRLKRHLHW